jgi:hypothetical protein
VATSCPLSNPNRPDHLGPMGDRQCPLQVSVSCRPGTPTYNLQVKKRSRTCTYASPCALQHWTLPPSQCRLRDCHVSSGSVSCLHDEKGSSATTCPMALNPASLQGRAPVRHVSYKFGSCLCDRTTSKMRGLSPKIISGDSRRSENAQTHTNKHTIPNMKFKLKLL